MNFADCACSGRTLGRMLRPALLGLLAREPVHGYVLLQKLGQLSMFADTAPDTGGVYRALKSMEDEGLVTSSWDTGGSGPAKRCYELTPDGHACLGRWQVTLEDYRDQIDEIARMTAAASASRRSDNGEQHDCE